MVKEHSEWQNIFYSEFEQLWEKAQIWGNTRGWGNPNALFWMVRREEVKPLCLVEHHKEIYIIENLKA